MNVPFSALTLWKYVFLGVTIVITVAVTFLISCGVLALGGAGSVEGAYTATILGFLAMSVAFWGGMAAVRQSKFMSHIFIGLTILCIILQTVAMIAFIVMKDKFTGMAVERIKNTWENREEQPDQMNDIQEQYSCCGRESPQDYLEDDDDVLPASCCRNKNCDIDTNIFGQGCAIALVSYILGQNDNLILINVGSIGLQVLSIAAAYYFCRNLIHRIEKRERIVISE